MAEVEANSIWTPDKFEGLAVRALRELCLVVERINGRVEGTDETPLSILLGRFDAEPGEFRSSSVTLKSNHELRFGRTVGLNCFQTAFELLKTYVKAKALGLARARGRTGLGAFPA